MPPRSRGGEIDLPHSAAQHAAKEPACISSGCGHNTALALAPCGPLNIHEKLRRSLLLGGVFLMVPILPSLLEIINAGGGKGHESHGLFADDGKHSKVPKLGP
jgi:hypothetical protein